MSSRQEVDELDPWGASKATWRARVGMMVDYFPPLRRPCNGDLGGFVELKTPGPYAAVITSLIDPFGRAPTISLHVFAPVEPNGNQLCAAERTHDIDIYEVPYSAKGEPGTWRNHPV